MFARQPAHAFTFAAHHNGHIAGEIGLIDQARRFTIQAIHPYARFFDGAQGTCQIGHRNHRNAIRRTGRNLSHGSIERRGFVFRDNHGAYTGGSGRAQTGAEVMRILYAIKYQQQGLALGIFNQTRQFGLFGWLGGFIAGNHALMAQAAGNAF